MESPNHHPSPEMDPLLMKKASGPLQLPQVTFICEAPRHSPDTQHKGKQEVATQPLREVTGHLLPSTIPNALSCLRKTSKSDPPCSSGIRETRPSLPRMKNRSGPAKALPLGIRARAAQAIPTPGLFGVGPWLLLWARWLRPEFDFLMTAPALTVP